MSAHQCPLPASGRLALLVTHLCLTLTFALGLSGCGPSDSSAKQASALTASAASSAAYAASGIKPSITVQTVLPQQGLWPTTVSAHGAVAAWQEAVIGAEVSGLRLTEVLVNVGDVVHKGQVLALLRTDALQADLGAAKASWVEAVALLTEAKANAERARKLQGSDAISTQEAQRAFTADLTAQARVDALKAQLAANELRLAQSKVLASDDGVISARLATVGSVVQPGQELFRLIRQQRLEWRAEVAAVDLHRLRPGQAAQLIGPSGQVVQGRVRRVAPTVDAATRNGLVFVDMPVGARQAAGLQAGMYVGGRFDVGQAQGLVVPQTAVLLRDGFSYVFRVLPGGKVMQLKVSVGRRLGEQIEITQGLDAQTRVVASGVGFLADGDTVRVVDDGKAASALALARR